MVGQTYTVTIKIVGWDQEFYIKFNSIIFKYVDEADYSIDDGGFKLVFFSLQPLKDFKQEFDLAVIHSRVRVITNGLSKADLKQ